MKRKYTLFILVPLLCFTLLSHKVQAEIAPPTIAAESAILIDAASKTILYEKNAYKKQYPASITKLMTALLAIENLAPTDVITFSNEAIFSIERASSHIGMDVGEQITVDQALHGLLLMSANEVANGLAEATSGSIETFAIRMTERAKELGTLNTHFTNPHGLHDENHYTTAYDMSLIASYLSDNPYFLEIMKDTTYEIPGTNKTDEIRYLSQQHYMLNPLRNGQLYREDVIGGKTGYTDIARQTLVTIAKQGDTTLVAVILKSEKSTLYTDTAALLDYGFDAYYSLDFHSPNEVLKTLPIYSIKSGQAYQAGNCSISVETPVSVLVNKSIKARDITTILDLPEYVDLGASKGDLIGEITYLYNSEILGKTKLIIQDISYSPSPYVTVLPNKDKLPSIKWPYIIVIFIIILVIFLLFKTRKKRKRYVNQLKFKKLFK